MSDSPIPAAQYLRVSRQVQIGSIPEQIAGIQRFAEVNNFEIIQTYRDTASGLLIKNRSGLQQLLSDVLAGQAQYRAVLVHDVSRWGRFQDTDEAAYYEFLCKKAGVRVHYCAEPFANNQSIAGCVGKALKRAMAAEYSRELSAKCFQGQKNLASLGFRMGAVPGYGLRRLAISSDGRHRTSLSTGVYKALSTDRVVLIPGPGEEVACVRYIFRALLDHHKSPTEIAQDLNRKNQPYRNGKPWPAFAVERILKNPKYAGDLVWNRTSTQLRTPRIQRAHEDWVIKQGAFASLVGPADFAKAQRKLTAMSGRWSDEQLLSKLKRLLARKGRLSSRLISNTRGMASTSTYFYHFGGLRRIYSMIGYSAKTGTFRKAESREMSMLVRDQLLSGIKRLFSSEIAVCFEPDDLRLRPLLVIRRVIRIGIRICRQRCVSGRAYRWRLLCGNNQLENGTLLCLLNRKNDKILKFHLIPNLKAISREYSLKGADPLLRGAVTFTKLEDLLLSVNQACALPRFEFLGLGRQ